MNNEPNNLNVLIVEDVPEDAALIEHELKKGGFQLHAGHAADLEGFLRVLRRRPPDVIFSDHGLPSFDGFAALALARQRCPDTPFIFVTGTMSEETAIKSIERGATEYVLKSRLKELVPVVRRALAFAEERRRFQAQATERIKQIQELRATLARRGAVPPGHLMVQMCASCRQVRDNGDQWKPLEAFVQAQLGIEFSHGMCPDCAMEWYGGSLSKPT